MEFQGECGRGPAIIQILIIKEIREPAAGQRGPGGDGEAEAGGHGQDSRSGVRSIKLYSILRLTPFGARFPVFFWPAWAGSESDVLQRRRRGDSGILAGMKTSTEVETAAGRQIATLMVAAARTAPKTRGVDNIRVVAIEEAAERQQLVAKMREIAAAENRPSLARDAGNIEHSPAVVVLGVADNPAGLNCGYCGKATCEALGESKGICAFNSIDLGIATASAAEVGGRFHADNRVMYSIGRAALDLGWLGKGVNQALGIPLSITGKNPFFDRK